VLRNAGNNGTTRKFAVRKEIEAKAEAQSRGEEAARKQQQEKTDLQRQRLESERLAPNTEGLHAPLAIRRSVTLCGSTL
jgi:hypothetical protein